MSEYQYYEFRAIDKPLDEDEMDDLERVGSILSTLKSKARQVLKRSSRGA